eukprot:SAG25_NODE_42_length_19413_cov_107.539609_16_plen_190_part_00
MQRPANAIHKLGCWHVKPKHCILANVTCIVCSTGKYSASTDATHRFCTTLYLSSGPGATGSTGVLVEGGQGVCGRGGGGGGLIYWEDMAYHCHSLLRDVLQRCCCCYTPSSLGAVRCFLIPLGPLSLLPSLRRGTGTLCRRGRWTCRPGCSSCTLISAPRLVRTLPRCRCDAVPRFRLAAGCWSAFPAC